MLKIMARKNRFQLMPYFRLWRVSLMIGLTIVFASLAEDVWFKEGFTWDVPVALAIHQFSRPWLDVMMKVITQTGNLGAIGLVIGLAFWFYWRRQPHQAILLVTTFGSAVGINALLKLVFARSRPLLFPPLVLETDYSFPSGHAVAAISLYGLLAVLLWRQRHYGWALLAGVWVLAVAVSRVYLGVHYPSDVLASLTIGGLWLYGAFFVFDWVERRIQSDLCTNKDQ